MPHRPMATASTLGEFHGAAIGAAHDPAARRDVSGGCGGVAPHRTDVRATVKAL